MKLDNIKKIRVILWLILACFLIFFLWMGIVPTGKIVYSRDFNQENESYFIKKLTPKERVTEINNSAQKIIGDPAYFFLYTPRRFDKCKLILKYKSDLPIIETGVLLDKKSWNYRLYPIENGAIDELMKSWSFVRDNNLVLLQRDTSTSSVQEKFSSVNEFLKNMPDLNRIALYNYDLNQDFILSDYASSSEEKILDYSLRGDYQFYTYIAGEDLDFRFNFFDINKDKEADPVEINLYYNDELVDNKTLEDDGVTTDTGEISEERSLEFKTVGLPEGVYKMEVKASDDIITKEIRTRQNKLAFINRLWIYENGKKNFVVYTDVQNLKAQTINPGSLQKIKVGEKFFDIKETYKQFGVLLEGGESEIKIAKSDIMIAGNGVFSFDKPAMINPRIKKVESNFSVESVDYILAEYVGPRKDNDWKIVEVEIDLSGAYREEGEYKFIISAPDLSEENYLELDEIKMELEGKSLWEKLKSIIQLK